MEEGSIKLTSDVNEDVLHEILIRLPDSGDAIRASTACKRWFSVVHNPYFINSFDRRHENSIVKFTILCRWEDQACRFHSHELSFPADGEKNCLDFLPWKAPRTKIVASSCGGLLLLCLTDRDFCVCNPLTKQWRFLPPPPLPRNCYTVLGTCGLITLPNGEFKVVFMEADYQSRQLWAKVFCSESRKWTKTVTVLSRRVICPSDSAAVSADGVLYWAEGYCQCRGVVAYDPAAGAARLIRLPSSGFDERSRQADHTNVRLGAVRGRLRLMQMVGRARARAHRLRVWELEDRRGEGEWRLVQEARCLRLPGRAWVLGFHPGEGSSVFLRCGLADVCRYDFAGGGKVEMVGRLDSTKAVTFNFQAFILAYPPSWPKQPIPRLRNKKRKKPKSMELKQKRRRI